MQFGLGMHKQQVFEKGTNLNLFETYCKKKRICAEIKIFQQGKLTQKHMPIAAFEFVVPKICIEFGTKRKGLS